MISLCQEGKALPTRYGGARTKVFSSSSARGCASRRSFLRYAEPDIHLLSWLPSASTEDLVSDFPPVLKQFDGSIGNLSSVTQSATARPAGRVSNKLFCSSPRQF